MNEMARVKFNSEWWTAPAESESGAMILVTGRSGLENVIATGEYNDRIEVTWKYEADAKGFPDFATSKLMEEVTDALNKVFDKDRSAVMTGIYTGDGERTLVFYTLNPKYFQNAFNRALAPYPLLPLSIYAEKDPEWNEYRERLEAEIIDSDDEE